MAGPEEKQTGTLSVVGTPIGNPGDITLRAVETLRAADIIACEERREGQRLCRRMGMEKELIEINEHTERGTSDVVIDLLLHGKNIALVSDCGMPVIADPGSHLIRQAVSHRIRVEIVPGITSITTALASCGFDVSRFYYYGFLSPKKEERRKELTALRSFPHPLVFLDTPYRLRQVLDDLAAIFGPTRNASVACDLTTKEELIRRGTLAVLQRYFSEHTQKREFVITVEGSRGR
jgi:16S rRNA (cytidine1402-2'-O)-methyltransferase